MTDPIRFVEIKTNRKWFTLILEGNYFIKFCDRIIIRNELGEEVVFINDSRRKEMEDKLREVLNRILAIERLEVCRIIKWWVDGSGEVCFVCGNPISGNCLKISVRRKGSRLAKWHIRYLCGECAEKSESGMILTMVG